MNDVVKQYINAHSKSQIIGFLLTLLFGPLGLFYSNWVAAVILSGIAFSTLATIIVPIICWLLAIPISLLIVGGHNKKVRATAELGVIQQ